MCGGSPFSDSDESKVLYESESHDVDGSQDSDKSLDKDVDSGDGDDKSLLFHT